MSNFIKKIIFVFFALVLLKGSDALAFDSAVDRPFFIEGVDTFEISSYIIERIIPIICVSYDYCPDDIFVVVDTPAEFPYGVDSLWSFINRNLRRKVNELTGGGRGFRFEGMVFVTSVIEKDGSISNVRILRGVSHDDLNEVAIRVVEMMPNWTPSRHQGRVVRTQWHWPIRFTFCM